MVSFIDRRLQYLQVFTLSVTLDKFKGNDSEIYFIYFATQIVSAFRRALIGMFPFNFYEVFLVKSQA